MTDSTKILICPSCGKEMKKIAMPSQNLYLDICTDGCGGIWFDNRELKFFDEQCEDIEEIKKALENKTFTEVDSSVTRICPVCNVKMVKNGTGATQKVQIDECYTCGGKFFDYNEILGMREEYKSEDDRSKASLELFNQVYSNEIQAHQQSMKTVNPSSGKRMFDSNTKNIINFFLYNM